MKKVILVFIIASLTSMVGCFGKSEAELAKEKAATTKAIEPEIKNDGSTLMVAESESGIKSEIKTFATGVLIQVTRGTWPDGRRTVTVKLRNGHTVDLQDRNDIDRAIEMTSDELVAAVKKVPGAAEYANMPAPAPATTQPPETTPKAKNAENPQPMKVANEGTPSTPTDKTKTPTSKKRR